MGTLVLPPERQIYPQQSLLLILCQPRLAEDRVGQVPVSFARVEYPCTHVKSLGRDPQCLRYLLKDLGGRAAQTTLDLAQVRVGYPRHVGQPADREARDGALLSDELTELSPRIGELGHDL